MSTEIVQKNDGDNNNETVNVDGTVISIKKFQSFYNAITGKTENLSKRLRESHQIEFSDFQQLDIKISQMLEQYKVLSKNCSVSVYYHNDCKEQFSTFERFSIYNKSSPNPCTSVHIEYDIVILPPDLDKPQQYKIQIDLVSRIGLKKKLQEDQEMSERFFKIVSSYTGEIDIDYIDYTIARVFLMTIEEWYKAIKSSKKPKIISALQKKSANFPFIFKTVTGIIFLISVLINSEDFISPVPSLNSLFIGFILAFGLFYLSCYIAHRIGKFCERSIDKYQSLSFIKLNQGDIQEIENFNSYNKKGIKYFILSWFEIIILNILASYLLNIILFI